MSENLREMKLENRVQRLSNNPVENVRLINKAKRQLRNLRNKK